MLCQQQFVFRDQPLFVRVNQVIENFGLRPFCDADELRELLVLESSESPALFLSV